VGPALEEPAESIGRDAVDVVTVVDHGSLVSACAPSSRLLRAHDFPQSVQEGERVNSAMWRSRIAGRPANGPLVPEET